MVYLLITIGLFCLSIITFVVRNRRGHLTFRQILALSYYDNSKNGRSKGFTDSLLILSVVVYIVFSPLPTAIKFCVGLTLIILHKVVIWGLLLILRQN